MVAMRKQQPLQPSATANVAWFGPLPLWATPGPNGLRMFDERRLASPAILRFDHDDFMLEYIDTLRGEPQRLGEWVAQPETWRQPMKTPKVNAQETESTSKIEFLYENTYRLAQQKRPAKAMPISLIAQKRQQSRLPIPLADGVPPTLKLFQPAQQRHYLVTASLLGRQPGFPDHAIDVKRKEKVSFVVRRLLPPDEDANQSLENWTEFAFVPGATSNGWRKLGLYNSKNTQVLCCGEEQAPMFPANFKDSCNEDRRLFNGVIPVAKREAFMGAQIGGDQFSDTSVDAALGVAQKSRTSMLFYIDVIAPWKILLEKAAFNAAARGREFDNFDIDSDKKNKDDERQKRSQRDEIQTGSWYVLLDFALFLESHLPQIWSVLKGDTEKSALDDNLAAEFVDLLHATQLSTDLALATANYPLIVKWHADSGWSHGNPLEDTRFFKVEWNLANAIVAAYNARDGLERVDTTLTRFDENGVPLAIDDRWPDFVFPLADPDSSLLPPIPPVPLAFSTSMDALVRRHSVLESFAAIVDRLLPQDEMEQGVLNSVPAGDAREGWFVVRCVYEKPHCGPLFPAKLSDPTEVFQLAPFFDPDAPARPVRIPMPMDISPAGLRKYQKNTGFVISDLLCGQIKKIRGMSFGDLVLSVLPWPFHKDLPNPSDTGPCKDGSSQFGMVCSLSIPIVTLVALILMMIIVALFDLFFRWIPYLFVCLPIPGLKGKS